MLDHKYKVFYHLAQTPNTTKVAEELLLSQPAISKNIKELENQLLSKIGNFSTRKKDAIQYEKVHRYLYLVRLLYELKERLKQDGLVITVHNGQQRFQKANSLIKEINTTSNQLLAIERSFDFEVENSPVEKKPPSDGSDLL